MVAWLAAASAFGQSPSFEIASIKGCKTPAGQDGNITSEPERFTARNATLKRLIFEAYQVPYAQITGGPSWMDIAEYDIDAKAEKPENTAQIRLMLRRLLAERFRLVVRSEMHEARVYALVVGKGGPRLGGAEAKEAPGRFRFHGDMAHFAGMLAIQLTIPLLEDPTVPSHARGAPIPVIDKTGIEGSYDLSVEIRPEAGGDSFTIWQNALQEQLGLKLESRKAPIETLIVEHADKVPTEN